MTLRKQISTAAGIPQKRPEAIFSQPVARSITVATQFQSDLELLLLYGIITYLPLCSRGGTGRGPDYRPSRKPAGTPPAGFRVRFALVITDNPATLET